MGEKHNALAETAVALELARPVLDTAGFEILEINGQCVWPRDRWQDAGFAFYIGKKGAPMWDATQWLEVPLPPLSTSISGDEAVALVGKAITEGLELARARQ